LGLLREPTEGVLPTRHEGNGFLLCPQAKRTRDDCYRNIEKSQRKGQSEHNGDQNNQQKKNTVGVVEDFDTIDNSQSRRDHIAY
jgi:hypothetical protein